MSSSRPAGRATWSSTPSRSTALSIRPVDQITPFINVPSKALPLASAAIVPLASSNRRRTSRSEAVTVNGPESALSPEALTDAITYSYVVPVISPVSVNVVPVQSLAIVM